jgi:hypothetical protein
MQRYDFFLIHTKKRFKTFVFEPFLLAYVLWIIQQPPQPQQQRPLEQPQQLRQLERLQLLDGS